MMKKLFNLGGILVVLGLASVLLGDDLAQFMQWWLAVFVLGLIWLPITGSVFSSFRDKGYLFSKVIGLAGTGYLVWLLSSIHVLKFTSIACWLGMFLVAVPNALVLWYQTKKQKLPFLGITKKDTKVLDRFLEEELLFLILFLVWCYIKGFKAQAYGTEKFMDYGFMTAMMRSDYMPPSDPWYAGGSINYYYFGQYLATFLTKLSRVDVSRGYNLMLMMIAAFSTALPYSIVSQITSTMLEKKGKEKPVIPQIAGLLSGILITCSGNMHFVLYRWIVPTVRDILGIKGEFPEYWFASSTRYIGYYPETMDKTIHEFPSYSIILGDLHAHLINLIGVLTVVGILFAWLLYEDRRRWNAKIDWKNKISKREYYKEICHPNILMITFFIGLFHMTNYWDYPIYYVVSGAVILFTNLINYQWNWKAIKMTALQGILVLLGSKIVALPFNLRFEKMSSSIGIATDHTPLYQLFILWGFPVIIVVGFIASCIHDHRKQLQSNAISIQRNSHTIGNKKDKSNTGDTWWEHSKLFLEERSCADLFILLLGLCAMGLVLMPELVYVKDIYSGSYKRANTMFKLTYQAYIMFCLCSGYIVTKLLFVATTWKQRKCAIVGLILALITCGYCVHSTKVWFGDVTKREHRKNLDATEFMNFSMPEDVGAIAWLNEHVKGQAVILESNGDSYSDHQRVSTMTGLQTVLGWYVHEQLWRSNTEQLSTRKADIQTMYTSVNDEEVKNLVVHYGIDYIYVGSLEYKKFGQVNDNLLKSLGEVVYSNAGEIYNSTETYIVKVAKD